MEQSNPVAANSAPFNWRLVLWWILATVVGLAIGRSMNGVLLGIPLALTYGLAIGTLQWLVIRQYISNSVWWLPATVIGVALSAILGIVLRIIVWFTLDSLINPDIAFLLGIVALGLVLGTGVGTLQFLVLRRQIARPGLWIVTSVVGWATGISLGETVYSSILNFGDHWAFVIINGVLVGGITGVTLSRQLHRFSILPRS